MVSLKALRVETLTKKFKWSCIVNVWGPSSISVSSATEASYRAEHASKQTKERVRLQYIYFSTVIKPRHPLHANPCTFSLIMSQWTALTTIKEKSLVYGEVERGKSEQAIPKPFEEPNLIHLTLQKLFVIKSIVTNEWTKLVHQLTGFHSPTCLFRRSHLRWQEMISRHSCTPKPKATRPNIA